MGFEKTKEVAATHSEAEFESEEETEDLNTAEEEATEDGHSEESSADGEEDTSTNETSEEDTESAAYWKAKAEKAESNAENYKRGLLSAKAKKRNLDEDSPRTEQVEVNEEIVLGVLGKQAEKKALQNTIDPKNSDYIPELVDDAKYNEILAYLPRNMDKSDYGSIVKSLKLATKLWKEEHGIKDPVKKQANIPSPKTTAASGAAPTKPKQFERKFFKPQSTMESWYSKN